MPIYEYVCKVCGTRSELIQKVSDPAPDACLSCGAAGPLERVVSRSSFQLKGGGWYADLYSSPKKDASKGESKPAETKPAETKAAETKPAETKSPANKGSSGSSGSSGPSGSSS